MWKSQFPEGIVESKPCLTGGCGVDHTLAPAVPLKAIFPLRPRTRWVISHDADVQTPEPEEEEQARVSGSHADQRGPPDPQPAPATRSAALGGERRLEIESVGEPRPAARAPGDFGLPPSSRITRTRDIRALLRRGKRKKTSHLDVFFLSSEGGGSRVGVVVPKHGSRVVDRNRLKRRLREIVRRELLPRLKDEGLRLDLLVRGRKEAYQASYRRLRAELLEVTEELCSGQYSWR